MEMPRTVDGVCDPHGEAEGNELRPQGRLPRLQGTAGRAALKGVIVIQRTTRAVALFLITVAVGAGQSGSQAAKGPTDLLADQADAVVVGQIQSGQQNGYSVHMALLVVRTLKGALAAGAVVNVGGTTGIAQNKSLGGQYGLWFLKSTGGGWAFLPASPGRAPLETSAYLPLLTTASPSDLSVTAVPSTVSDQIALELGAAVQGYHDPNTLFNLAWTLSGIGGSTVAPGLFQTLRSNPDPEIRFIGLIGAWNGSGDASALGEIADNVGLISKIHTSSLVGSSICGTRDAGANTVQYLGKIASAEDVNFARCAVMALDFIHTRDALPLLAQALNSADPNTRELAMQGLSRFVDSLPIQTPYNGANGQALISKDPTPYRTSQTDRYALSRGSLDPASEAEYLQFWKSWWTTVQDKLTGN
jgi:hypothetical protein